MPRRHGCRRWIATATALTALGGGACEPLDLALFPVPQQQDAGADPPVEEPPPPPVEAPADAGGSSDADGDASSDAGSDAGALPPPPPACLPGATACEACLLAATCPAGEICHPFSGECVPACADSEPRCAPGLVCSPLDVCVECVSDAQCTRDDDEPRCDTQRGVCIECFTSVDCTDDPFERPVCLAGGICGCASDADCSGGALCELDEAHCEIEDD